ncbi:E3 ubiquitin-protein ligase MYCBP2-like [Anoplophora glabripennis]|uniref:E3 ubiquitin-protein ligase MYCBP2-like n=1 Tax=Anoplophora glabripennis TaxID=217634 RepID=UPI000C77007C|nr:E3 ubiquitin-protein ligase MYCBP2-like [Anoplophora glabripennis]
MDKNDIKTNVFSKWFQDVKSNETVLTIGNNISVKHTSECNANGNRITASDAAIGSQSPKSMSRSSSPVGILFSGMSQARRSSNQSDTSALVSSITRDISQSLSQTREMSPSPGGSPLHTQSESSPTPTSKNDSIVSEQIQHKQTGTQTSPDYTNKMPIKPHFSIGITGKEEKISPKLIRKDRTIAKVRSKRSISPAQLQQLPTNLKMIYSETESVKQAMSPSLAEALRAIFAAFLWHEGM